MFKEYSLLFRDKVYCLKKIFCFARDKSVVREYKLFKMGIKFIVLKSIVYSEGIEFDAWGM